MPEIWSVYDADDRLVLAISDDPGEFHFSKMPDEEVEPLECAFATLQCFDSKSEPELLNHLYRADDLQGFFERLEKARYKVRKGRPLASKIARL